MNIIKPEGFPSLPSDWHFESLTITPQRLLSKKEDPSLLFISCFKKHHFKTGKILLILHGLGEHGGRYQHFAHFLNEEIDAIYCLDHQGHGRSFGLRGHIHRFSDFVDDAVSFIRKIENIHQESKIPIQYYLYGHSMGGLITAQLIQNYSQLNLSGVVLSAPLIQVAFPVPFYKHYPAFVLNSFWDNLEIPSGLKVEHLSHDLHVQKAYLEDELNHDKVTPRLYMEMNKAMEQVSEQVSKKYIPYPLLFLIPMEDKIVSAPAALEFYQATLAKNKNCEQFPGFFHEPHNEIDKKRVFQKVSEFLKK